MILKHACRFSSRCNADRENEKKFFGQIFVRFHGHVPTGVSVDSHQSNGNIDLEDYLQNNGDEPDTKDGCESTEGR